MMSNKCVYALLLCCLLPWIGCSEDSESKTNDTNQATPGGDDTNQATPGGDDTNQAAPGGDNTKPKYKEGEPCSEADFPEFCDGKQRVSCFFDKVMVWDCSYSGGICVQFKDEKPQCGKLSGKESLFEKCTVEGEKDYLCFDEDNDYYSSELYWTSCERSIVDGELYKYIGQPEYLPFTYPYSERCFGKCTSSTSCVTYSDIVKDNCNGRNNGSYCIQYNGMDVSYRCDDGKLRSAMTCKSDKPKCIETEDDTYNCYAL